MPTDSGATRGKSLICAVADSVAHVIATAGSIALMQDKKWFENFIFL